jgi:hypothetical protein
VLLIIAWLDYERNTDIAKKLNITTVLENAGLQEKLDTTCKQNAL